MKKIAFTLFVALIVAQLAWNSIRTPANPNIYFYLSIPDDKLFTEARHFDFISLLKNKDFGTADLLLRDGFDIEFKGFNGLTPLGWSIIRNDTVAWSFLLGRGANPANVVVEPMSTNYPYSIIELAAINPDTFYIHSLFKRGLDPNTPTASTARLPIVYSAIHTHQYETVELLIRKGANLKYRHFGQFEQSPLDDCRDYKMVYLLLQNGADLVAETSYGASYLSGFKRNGWNRVDTMSPTDIYYYFKVKQFLIEKGYLK